jgi:rsbT antagonist protein RsbS
MDEEILSGLSLHISEGCLIVPIQGEINDERMNRIQKQILEGVEDTGAKGVVIDVSGVKIIEPYHARILDNTAKMIYLLGAKTVLTGIRPGVAISLIDSNFEFKEIYGIATTFEDGVKKLKSVVEIAQESGLEKLEEEIEEIQAFEEIGREEEVVETAEEVDLEERYDEAGDNESAGEEEEDID